MAEWLRNGLQNRVLRFNSGRGLHNPINRFGLRVPRASIVRTPGESRRFALILYTRDARGLNIVFLRYSW